MEKILYFKDSLPEWIKQLIKGVKSKDEVVVLKERQDGMILIHHESSDYQGWMSPEHFVDDVNIITIEPKKPINWEID